MILKEVVILKINLNFVVKIISQTIKSLAILSCFVVFLGLGADLPILAQQQPSDAVQMLHNNLNRVGFPCELDKDISVDNVKDYFEGVSSTPPDYLNTICMPPGVIKNIVDTAVDNDNPNPTIKIDNLDIDNSNNEYDNPTLAFLRNQQETKSLGILDAGDASIGSYSCGKQNTNKCYSLSNTNSMVTTIKDQLYDEFGRGNLGGAGQSCKDTQNATSRCQLDNSTTDTVDPNGKCLPGYKCYTPPTPTPTLAPTTAEEPLLNLSGFLTDEQKRSPGDLGQICKGLELFESDDPIEVQGEIQDTATELIPTDSDNSFLPFWLRNGIEDAGEAIKKRARSLLNGVIMTTLPEEDIPEGVRSDRLWLASMGCNGDLQCDASLELGDLKPMGVCIKMENIYEHKKLLKSRMDQSSKSDLTLIQGDSQNTAIPTDKLGLMCINSMPHADLITGAVTDFLADNSHLIRTRNRNADNTATCLSGCVELIQFHIRDSITSDNIIESLKERLSCDNNATVYQDFCTETNVFNGINSLDDLVAKNGVKAMLNKPEYFNGNDSLIKSTMANLNRCLSCAREGGVATAIGCIQVGDMKSIVSVLVFRIGIGIAGSFCLLCIVYGAVMIQLSQGDSAKITKARKLIINCLLGLALIIFSVFVLDFIGIKLLRIPGLSN
jgi:hypothetical protein